MKIHIGKQGGASIETPPCFALDAEVTDAVYKRDAQLLVEILIEKNVADGFLCQ